MSAEAALTVRFLNKGKEISFCLLIIDELKQENCGASSFTNFISGFLSTLLIKPSYQLPPHAENSNG